MTVLVSASLVAGCTAVGPEYRAPALPAHVGETPTGFKEGRSPAYSPAPLPAHWWQLYADPQLDERSEEHTSALQSLMRISYAVFCLKKTQNLNKHHETIH